MKKLLAVCFVLFLAYVHSSAQTTPLPFYENFDTGSMAGWTKFTRGVANGDIKWAPTIHSIYSEPFALTYTCSGAGTSNIVDEWCVTPAFAFPAGGKIDSMRSFSYPGNMPGSADTLAVYLLQGSPDPALATSKQLLYDFRGANNPQGVWNKASSVNIPAATGNCYIAFRYKVLNNCLSLFIDNLHISGNAANKIGGMYKAGEDFTVGPNPVTGVLSIETRKEFAKMSVYESSGKKVFSGSYEPVINTGSWPVGTYFLELTDLKGIKGVTQFMKR